LAAPAWLQSNLLIRTLTAVLGIPIVLALDHTGGIVFGVVLAVVAGLTSLELYQMLRQKGLAPFVPLGMVCSAALACMPLLIGKPRTASLAVVVVLIVFCGAYALIPRVYASVPLLTWASTIAPALYVGLLLSYAAWLRALPEGAWWVFMLLVITWAYDTGAYLVGRSVGRHPFMHHVSPKKTVEGVVGGTVVAGLAGVSAVYVLHISLWQGLLLGILGGIMAQLGDLVESMMKRQTGVKDSGALIPGHGGLLDRIDGLLFVGPLVYYAALLLHRAS